MSSSLSVMQSSLAESVAVKQAYQSDPLAMGCLSRACECVLSCYRQGGKLLVAGNGGSALDAQHVVSELVNRFRLDRQPLPALALTADNAIVTAIGNDYGYDEVFSRQVVAHGQPGDVFLGITTSGQSGNVLAAARMARSLGLQVIGLTGADGGALAALSDICLCVPSTVTARIQECHLLIEHVLCDYVEQGLFGG